MSSGYNPPPVTPNLQAWAQNTVTYLQRVASRLAFKRDDARAVENGVILWDEVNKRPEVSKDNEWRPVPLTDVVFVASAGDFPDAVGGVITLGDYATYWITGEVDLEGDRIVAGQSTSIIGSSADTSRLKSTGLTDALITSEWAVSMRYLTLEASTVFDLDASGNADQILDWYAVSVISANVGTIANYTDFVSTSMAFRGATGLVLDGTFNTIAFASSIFEGSSGTLIEIPSTATILRRFRTSYSAVVATGTATGIDVSASATIPVEGYILDTVNFAGGGTPLAGTDYSSDSALFVENRGITNTSVISGFTMNGNATATTIAVVSTAVKAAGTTAGSSISQKFDNTTSNRALYTGALPRNFFISVTCALSSGNNNEISIYIAKNGTVISESRVKATANAAGRAESVSTQFLPSLVEDDYIEVFVANDTAVNDITVSDLNVSLLAVAA